MPQQLIIYWLIAQIIGLAGLPLARLVIGALPDVGYPFAKTLGLLTAGYLAWLLAMLGLAPFGTGLVIGCILIVALLGSLVHAEGRPRVVWAWLRANWRMVLAYEIIFTVAFVYLAIQRSYEWTYVGPHPWGTERPMDFAFFNAIQRSAMFPPHDPWMSGFTINYYYLGYLLMATVALLGGLPAGVSYNLSLALLFGLTAQGVAGLVVALARLTGAKNQEPRAKLVLSEAEGNPEPRTAACPEPVEGNPESETAEPQLALSEDEGSRGIALAGKGRVAGWAAALLSVLLVLGVSNQVAPLQVISGTGLIHVVALPDMTTLLANGIGSRESVTLSEPFNDVTTITPTDRVNDFDWWVESRALWDTFPDKDGAPPRKAEVITEFPFFSFWLGDMHPHVMSLPFTLLAAILALTALVRPDVPHYGQGRRGWAELLVIGIILGGLYVINSWDVPSYGLLFMAALLLRFAREQSPGRLGVDWRTYGIQALLVGFAAFVLYLPFHLTFRSLVGGRDPLIDFPVLATITRTIGVVSWPKTPLHTFLIIFGLFLVPILFWMGRIALRGAGRSTLRSSRNIAPWVVVLISLVMGVLIGLPLLVLAPLAIYASIAAYRQMRVGALGDTFALLVFALGCAICFGTELIYIRDGFGNRFNTIFKFYYQVWLLWGTLAGYALWRMLVRIGSDSTWVVRHKDNDGDPGEALLTDPSAIAALEQEALPAERSLITDMKIGDSIDASAAVAAQAMSDTMGISEATGNEDAHGVIGVSDAPVATGSQERLKQPVEDAAVDSPAVPQRSPRISLALRIAMLILFVPLLLGGLSYPFLTLSKLFGEGHQIGLNGTNPRERDADGAAAIAWLRKNAPGDAVLIEAVGSDQEPIYGYDTSGVGMSGVSSSTGLAAVIGWTNQQGQWRAGDPEVHAQIEPRRQDVQSIYTTPDAGQARDLLAKYKVRYIYVGPTERATYPPDGLAKFDQIATVAFQQGNVTIYEVAQ